MGGGASVKAADGVDIDSPQIVSTGFGTGSIPRDAGSADARKRKPRPARTDRGCMAKRVESALVAIVATLGLTLTGGLALGATVLASTGGRRFVDALP